MTATRGDVLCAVGVAVDVDRLRAIVASLRQPPGWVTIHAAFVLQDVAAELERACGMQGPAAPAGLMADLRRPDQPTWRLEGQS